MNDDNRTRELREAILNLVKDLDSDKRPTHIGSAQVSVKNNGDIRVSYRVVHYLSDRT